MESYNGILCTKRDALFLIEAAKQKLVPLVTQRFSSYERQTSIRAGSVYVWREQGSNIRRWTDGRKWSASRVSGVFLSYREMQPARSQTCHIVDQKQGGLIKQSFSYCVGGGDKYHVVSYAASDLDPASLARCLRPSLDPRFQALAATVDAAATADAATAEPPLRSSRKRALSVDSAGPAKRFSTSPPSYPPSPASPASPASSLSPLLSQPPRPMLPPLQSLLRTATPSATPCDFDRKTLLALRCSFS